MKDHPIIFITELIPEILDRAKTQTRRVITPKTSEVGEGKVDWSKFCWDGSEIYTEKCLHFNCQHKHETKAPLPFVDTGFPNPTTGELDSWYLHVPYHWTEDCTIFRIYPKWEVGDRLWVRERWATEIRFDHLKPSEIPEGAMIYYATRDGWLGHLPIGGRKMRTPLFMPRWASRITLEITRIRAERLQEINPTDIIKEGIRINGINPEADIQYRAALYNAFRNLWNRLNAKRGYPWKSNLWVWVYDFNMIAQKGDNEQ